MNEVDLSSFLFAFEARGYLVFLLSLFFDCLMNIFLKWLLSNWMGAWLWAWLLELCEEVHGCEWSFQVSNLTLEV